MSEQGGPLPDFELVRRMANEPFDPPAAREAWGQFYTRHHRFLSRIFVLSFGRAAHSGSLDEAVQDAFMRAYRAASTFDYQDQSEPESQEKRVRGWLARILENLVRDRLGDANMVSLSDEEEMERLAANAKTDGEVVEPPECERLKLLKSGMARLSDVEQTILLATGFWLRPGEQHQRMPHEAMEQLSRSTGKTNDNIRQIRSRAMKKLEKYINDHLGQ
jgi:RNA polymerase sigma factor (sigma-70 family)